jgi:hypothetical protein
MRVKCLRLKKGKECYDVSSIKGMEGGVLTAEEFAAGVDDLIRDARTKGLSVETLLVEIEDVASLLREEIDPGSPPSLRRRPPC